MKRIFAAMLLLLLASPAWGQEFQEFRGLPAPSLCAKAEKELRPLAKQGNADAQYFVAKAHELCFRLSFEGAAEWYRRAAEQGHADAQSRLGTYYMNGRGVPKDYEEAVKWWHKAAEQGDAGSMFALGNMSYECGGEVDRSCGIGFVPHTPEYAEAAKWYRLAAERGHIRAQLSIGAMYAEGLGVPQDYALAHMWFNLAAAQAGQGTRYKDVAVKARDTAAAKMSPGQIAEAQRLAREWKPKKMPPVSEGASQ